MANVPTLRPGESGARGSAGSGGRLPGSPAPSAGSPRAPHPVLCFQRLMAIRQVLSAQKISFLLRGGVRVLVAMRDEDTGERLAWPRPPGAPPAMLVTVGATEGPAPAHTLLLAEGSPHHNPGRPKASPSSGQMGRGALALIPVDI